MRHQRMYVSVLAVCGVLGWSLICAQARAADLTDAQYLKKRGPNVHRAHATIVQQAPQGFGTTITLDRKDPQYFIVAYINAADNLGPAILNLKKGDRVEILEIDGMPAFSDSNAQVVESIIGVAAAGVQAGLGAAAQPAPNGTTGQSAKGQSGTSSTTNGLIQAAGKFASTAFGQAKKGKFRDGYGKDEHGTMRRQEGGVLVCMPEAGGIFYSGGFFDRGRWIQGNDGGERTDNRLPKQMKNTGAFFPIRGNAAHNTRIAKADGILHLVPWDYNFTDNEGYYRVFVRITLGGAAPNTARTFHQPSTTATRPATPSGFPANVRRHTRR